MGCCVSKGKDKKDKKGKKKKNRVNPADPSDDANNPITTAAQQRDDGSNNSEEPKDGGGKTKKHTRRRSSHKAGSFSKGQGGKGEDAPNNTVRNPMVTVDDSNATNPLGEGSSSSPHQQQQGFDPRKPSVAQSEGIRSNSLLPVGTANPHQVDLLNSNRTNDDDSDSNNNGPEDQSFHLPIDDDDAMPMSEEILRVQMSLQERNVEALPLTVIAQQVIAGQLTLPVDMYVGDAFRTKMRFRDVDGWLNEVGHVPAPVVALVNSSNSVQRDAKFRLTAKQLEHNQRLILQLKSRTAHAAPKPPVSPAVGQREVNLTGGDEFDDDNPRKYSRASSAAKNRVDRNTKEQDIGVSDFFEELEEEERRLSTINGSSSDEDYG